MGVRQPFAQTRFLPTFDLPPPHLSSEMSRGPGARSAGLVTSLPPRLPKNGQNPSADPARLAIGRRDREGRLRWALA